MKACPAVFAGSSRPATSTRSISPTVRTDGLLAMGRWVRADGVLWRRTPDRIVLLPAGADVPVSVDGSGPLVWELLTEPVDPEEVGPVLADVSGDDPSVVVAGMRKVIDDLAALGAVVAVNP